MTEARKNTYKNSLRHFFKSDIATGVLLALSTLIALVWANTPMGGAIAGGHGWLAFAVNDILMVVFFFVVGLEIRREAQEGTLASPGAATLPFIAAAAGMALPALIFLLLNRHVPENIHGWAIPTATDIAFALGALSLAGRHIPASLRAFLLAIAVIDDLGAILVIAFFYTGTLNETALTLSGLLFATMFFMHRWRIGSAGTLLCLGIVLAAALHHAGIHTTIAGVVTALFIPDRATRPLEKTLMPWVSLGILPLFALVNAGVSFAGLSIDDLFSPLPLGIALGLLAGKPVGILGALFLATRLKIATLPLGTDWKHMAGVSMLCGIGFTMSLFIGALAFDNPAQITGTRLGILGGSVLSFLIGYAILASGKKPAKKDV